MQERFQYKDRSSAGEILADYLTPLASLNVVVLALPRGGVPVAEKVAERLHACLDVFLVRKLGVPGHEELAFGAIASGGVRVLNPEVMAQLQLPEGVLDQVSLQEDQELQRREKFYRGQSSRLPVDRKIVVLVDDGLATGATMRAAVQAVRRLGPQKVIVAVPVGARDTCELLEQEADEVICPLQPHFFHAVGMHYERFSQTTDEEVCQALARAAERNSRRMAAGCVD